MRRRRRRDVGPGDASANVCDSDRFAALLPRWAVRWGTGSEDLVDRLRRDFVRRRPPIEFRHVARSRLDFFDATA